MEIDFRAFLEGFGIGVFIAAAMVWIWMMTKQPLIRRRSDD